MNPFDIYQVAVFCFAVCSAYEEEAFSFPFRELYFNSETKFSKLKKAHRAGAAGVICILIVPLMLTFIEPFDWYWFLINGLVSLDLFLLYFLVFDIVYALQIGERWYYLGGTAGTDRIMKFIFGRYAGQIKAGISLLCIIAINLAIHKL